MATPPRTKPNRPDTTAPFKAAVSATLRAIAGKPDLEVAFSADRPILTSERARLANLPRVPTARDIAIARGQGDAMAMRLASHDSETHRKRAPMDADARAAFDALEQARVEALGVRRMPGMSGNIHEMLEDRLFRGNYAGISDRADAPIAEALGLLLREKVAGVAVPPSGSAVVGLWRAEIEKRAGSSLDALASVYEDQERFSRACRDVLRDLDLAPESEFDDSDTDDTEELDQDDGSDNQPEPREVDAQNDTGDQESTQSDAEGGDEEDRDDVDSQESQQREVTDEDMGEASEDAAATPSERGDERLSNAFVYKVFTTRFDETVKASELCPPTSWNSCAPFSTSNSKPLPAPSPASLTSCSAG